MIKKFKFPKNSRVQTLERLKLLNDPEFLRKMNFSDLTIEELKRLKSDDLQFLYKKEIDNFQKCYLKNPERLVDEKFTYFYECEVKQLTRALTKFRDQCAKNDLPVLELEMECVNLIIDENKRFIFKSKTAQRFYKIKNTLVASSLGYWGYKAVTKLGSTKSYLLRDELLKSSLPIAFFTGVTCKFWSYITKPVPVLSKTFNTLSIIALSPIWLIEFILNKATGQLSTNFNPVSVPLNVVGEIHSGTGLTWQQLNHTYSFVKKMEHSINYCS